MVKLFLLAIYLFADVRIFCRHSPVVSIHVLQIIEMPASVDHHSRADAIQYSNGIYSGWPAWKKCSSEATILSSGRSVQPADQRCRRVPMRLEPGMVKAKS